MAFDKANVRTSVEAKAQDDAAFVVGDEVDVNIDDALREMAFDRPFAFPVDIVGDNTQDYDLEGVGFVKGYSNLKTVELPAGENPPVILRRNDDYILYEDPTKAPGAQIRLRFISATPQPTQTIRVTITRSPVIADTTDVSFQALVYKTLVLLFRSLAAKMAQATDPTLDADTVDRGALGSNYLFLAERYETSYKKMIGLSEPVKAGQAMGDFDVRFKEGFDFFWHPMRFR